MGEGMVKQGTHQLGVEKGPVGLSGYVRVEFETVPEGLEGVGWYFLPQVPGQP